MAPTMAVRCSPKSLLLVRITILSRRAKTGEKPYPKPSWFMKEGEHFLGLRAFLQKFLVSDRPQKLNFGSNTKPWCIGPESASSGSVYGLSEPPGSHLGKGPRPRASGATSSCRKPGALRVLPAPFQELHRRLRSSLRLPEPQAPLLSLAKQLN